MGQHALRANGLDDSQQPAEETLDRHGAQVEAARRTKLIHSFWHHQTGEPVDSNGERVL